MDFEDPSLGKELTSKSGESEKVQKKWRQEMLDVASMNTLGSEEKEKQQQVNPEHIRSPTLEQQFNTLRAVSQNDCVQYAPEKQNSLKHPSTYVQRHSLSFPQHNVHQHRIVHNTKAHHSLEGHVYQFHTHLPVASDDMFFQIHGHGAGFSRKKFTGITSTYSQFPQKCMEPSDDAYKKEQKPKKPGKYICPYCTRACAKPSVLKKHIRSHTGERPYPCIPCGFSFKTKSNLYKHRKSHAHAIKAGLVPFSDSAVSKLELDASCIDVETEIHSDGEQSTDTDEETLLLAEDSQKSTNSQISLNVNVRSEDYLDAAVQASSDDSSGGSMKVPILIIPKGGIQTPSEAVHLMESELMYNPSLSGKTDDSHTVRQKLALRLTEKKVQDSEKSLNLLSPHSKGSTDSGYFSRSESAEQQICSPNANATSYEEIIFGKYGRLSPRSSMPNPEASFLVVNPAMIEEHVSHLITKREGLVEHGKFKSMKYRLSGIHTFEQHKSHSITDPVEPNTKLYPECQHDQAVLLAAPADTSPLIRSNSMPSYGTNLSIPPSIRGSHSFDEQVTGTDDVFYSGSVGVTHQKLLKRQGAFELPSVLESHSDFDSYARMSKNLTAVFNSKTMHDKPLTKEKKTSSLERVVHDVLGVPLKICDELEVQKQQIVKAGGDNVTEMMAPLQSRFGTMVENRKRRKEKSVGDEDDNTMSCSGIESPVISDFDNKHGATRSGIVVQGQEYPYCVPPERFDVCRLYTQLGCPLPVLDETAPGTDLDKMVDLNNKTPGNVISVIQHTNSLSRPNSFDKSESTELLAYQQDKTCSPFETSDSGNTMCSMSSDWAQLTDNPVATSQPSQQSLQSACHRLVRQHNITVPEIRVTEEPDKPEKEPTIPVKEPEKPPEEFQWPQRSETLSQLPAEKLPPKKKRLRLADLDNSSGESSFESTGTSLSRSPSQESNLSHSSSLSMSFEREELVKSTTPTKQEELGRQSEFLTVPPGSCSLSVSSHHQKEMRRSSSEQIPCPIPTETPEIRSKSFDYGNLIHSSEMESSTATLSPARERKKCFLVRQASFSGFPENMQADQELIGYQEPSDQMNITRISPLGWYHLPSSTLSGLASLLTENSGNIIVGTSAQPTSPLSRYSQQTGSSHNALKDPLAHQSHYISRRHVSEQQHPENMFYPVIQNAVNLPFTSVCMNSLPSHHLLSWPNSADQLQRHFQPNWPLQKSYLKPSNQSELHPTYYLEAAHKHAEHKPVSYSHGTEKVYQPYLETSAQTSKNMLVKVQRNHSGGSSDSDQHLQIVTASANSISLQPMPGTFVPVRIQTHVPSYGSVMYTSISQIAVTHTSTICKEYGSTSQSILATTASMRSLGFNIAQMLAPCGELEQYPLWKMPQTLALDLESAIPLCLSSSSDSTSGGGKRVLSPASSLELFIETKQQKRDKDENMYGQIVKELSAVELTSSDIKKTLCRTSKPQLVRQGCTTEQKSSFSSASPRLLPLSSGKELPEPKGSDSPECQMSPDELYDEDTSSDMSLSPQRTPGEGHPNSNKPKSGTLKQMSDSSSITERASYNPVKGCTERYCLQFPSLRTTTTVSWCFLNYSKPNHIEQESMKSSVYASWCTSSCNPNPSGLNTRTSLALLRSKQKNSVAIYTIAAFQKSGADKLTSSSMWKLQFAQVKPESYLLVSSKLEKTATGSNKERSKGELHGDKESTSKNTEPMRIKIFEGGFKSNEEYVYVRGRGRGKYICEECGIRCKKPSMLKKHIRTHTDVRPYVCKLCNFAFKTKGNLTKHMKSKAHMKKCLELGVAMSSIDDVETEESGNIEDIQRESEKGIAATDHQFSDAEESDVDDAEEDEDDDEEDLDDTHGDSTPKTRSRSTSPQPPRFSTQRVTVASACHRASPDGSIGHSFITSYLSTLPSIQVTNLMKQSTTLRDSQMVEYPTLSFTSLECDRDKIDVHDGIDEDYMLTSAPSSYSKDLSSCSRLSSPGYDPSPCRDNSPKKYLSLRGDLSPRRHLSPRRDASPMKHLSPRKEAALRRELSPGRDVSPRQNISPLRPMSPGKDMISGRDLSPRREKRYMASFRALSPRRRLHRNTSLPSSHYLHSDPELLGHGNLRKSWTQVPYTGLSTEDVPEHQSTRMTPDDHSDYIFSHLPLHSQQQIRAPLPMIPIGGIQMIHSISTIQPGPPPSTTKSLNPRSPEKGNIASESCKILHHEKHFSSKDPSRAAWTISNAARQRFKPMEGEQEENIHTCTKGIACLRIATEEGLPLNQDQLSTEPNKKKSLRAQLGIRHFTEPEVCPSTTHVDLHIEKDNLNT
ncbi:transcription factor HIVEP2 [Spea bombifrons]|uniref:transcription factor HIVEP2 n=1 Tax=Spea bombifrons TaxID=233779 RepID=UPI00234A2A05|nr:transcription factor HIVEP2 [Spea bombifrons]